MVNLTQEAKTRFDEKYIPEPNTGCWLWIAGACKTKNGLRPQFWDGSKNWIASRWVKEFEIGKKLPTHIYACHKCDTTLCVNPDHIFLGTAKDNYYDCIAKGRGKKRTATHCKRGHQFSIENVKIFKDGGRRCAVCYGRGIFKRDKK